MNRARILRETLVALLRYSVEPYEIIVVDNGSTDPDALKMLDAISHRVTIIRNETNLGLSIATNQGLEASKYDFIIHLDDDCLITTQGWNKIMRSYTSIPKIGMVAPTLTREAINHDRYLEIRWTLGMCWGIRKELFDDIGGYDPQLLHQNECDMALRVRMAGYHVAGIRDFSPYHNDPGGARSDHSLAREHLGCVQFRDKWTSYFRGRDWNYGTQPLYLMQHWPPDQEFYRRFALQEGLDLNPIPDEVHGKSHQERWEELDAMGAKLKIDLAGETYMITRQLINDYAHWEWRTNPHAYYEDRQKAIDRWFELTGERYEGYKWPHNLLRPY